jgi:DNA-directed RNA polymerase specialized sigma24 family protein
MRIENVFSTWGRGNPGDTQSLQIRQALPGNCGAFGPGRVFIEEAKGAIMNNALNEYIRTGSSDAFRQIVEAQIDAVYSQCLRRFRNVAQAEDVVQVVFTLLAERAAKLPVNDVLEEWLFTTTRFYWFNAQRAAARRTAAEHKAATMRYHIAAGPDLEPFVPEALNEIEFAPATHRQYGAWCGTERCSGRRIGRARSVVFRRPQYDAHRS